MRSRTGILAGRRLRGAAGWLGAGAVLLAVGGVLAAAGPAHADLRPVSGPRLHFATNAAQVKATEATATYSCDLGAYASGATATMSDTFDVFNPWVVNNPDDIFMTTGALTLPPAVATALSADNVDTFGVTTTVQAAHGTPATATVTGDTTGTTLPTPLTAVPSITGEGQVTFPAVGTAGTVTLPPASVVITPFAGSTGKPNITCTTTSTPTPIPITVAKATGQFYKCGQSVAGQTLPTESSPVAMTFSASGKRNVGSTDTVTLSTTDLLGLTSLPSGITAAFSGNLPVTGAQSGSVKLTGTRKGGSTGPFKATGTLRLTKAGTTHLLIPQTFTIALTEQGVSGTLTCTLQTSPAPTALTLSVAKGSGSSGGGGSGAQTQTSGQSSSTTTNTTSNGTTPVGAPATGGGIALMSDNTPAAAGASVALMAAGGALLLWARRRRARQQ